MRFLHMQEDVWIIMGHQTHKTERKRDGAIIPAGHNIQISTADRRVVLNFEIPSVSLFQWVKNRKCTAYKLREAFPNPFRGCIGKMVCGFLFVPLIQKFKNSIILLSSKTCSSTFIFYQKFYEIFWTMLTDPKYIYIMRRYARVTWVEQWICECVCVYVCRFAWMPTKIPEKLVTELREKSNK